MATRKSAAAKKEPLVMETIDTDLINPADVEPDPVFEDPDYDTSLAKVDPETQGEAEMTPDPGPDAKEE